MKADLFKPVEHDDRPGGFVNLAQAKAFAETQSILTGAMRREVAKKGFCADDEPCEFSNPNDPHPVLSWPHAGYACDGYGYVLAKDKSAASRKRCPCWIKWKRRCYADGYLAGLPEAMRLRVTNADQSNRWALGKALERWNYATPGLLLMGKSGTGKTVAGHVLIAGFSDKKGKQGLCIDADGISSDLRAFALPDGDETARQAKRRRYAHDECTQNQTMAILIDDIGRGRETQAVADTIRYLVRNLYNNHMSCVLTSNMGAQDIGRTYGMDVHRRLFETPEWMTVLNV